MDHIPITTWSKELDVTTLARRDHCRWPCGAVPGRSAWNDEVVEQAEVADELTRRDVSARVEQTGGWVMCLSLPCTTTQPDRCPDCGSIEIRYGGGRAGYCRECGGITDDEAVFEVGPCHVLAANLDGRGWDAGRPARARRRVAGAGA